MDHSLGATRLDRRDLLLRAASLTAATGLALPLTSAFAQDASPAASPDESGGMPPLPEGATVVGQGLWNPGNLAFGADGTLYIAEQGVYVGGTEGNSMATPGPDGSPVPAQPPLVPVQISAIAPDGTQTVLTTAIGGIGIGYFGESIFVSFGGGSVGSGFAPLPVENTVSAIDLASGDVRQLASLGPYEVANNPDGLDVNPNLYGLDIADDGTIYVADAGGNTIYKVASDTGEFSLFAVVPNLTDLTGSTPTAEEQAQQPGPRQPVPTSVAIAPDGTITVVLLSWGWNGPSILDYTTDGNYTARPVQLSMIVDAVYGPDGALYVSQLSPDFGGENPSPGAVFRVDADGTVTSVVDGLLFPQGIAFEPNSGDLLVATNSIISGPDAPLGMVLRFAGIATPAA